MSIFKNLQRYCIPHGLLLLFANCGCEAESEARGVAFVAPPALHREQVATFKAAPAKRMKGTGLAVAMGGIDLKTVKSGTHYVQLPIPQLTGRQIPLTYTLSSEPADVLHVCKLQQRDPLNTFALLRLVADRNTEIRLEWTAVVLLTSNDAPETATAAAPYLKASACVQANSDQIVKLAATHWPDDGSSTEYAARIQKLVLNLKQTQQPRSLDALGILDSGCNWICTANANLAAALMRARDIPARSLAVIPVTSQRLEMHRITSYFENDAWHAFDPSSVQAEVPLAPWQNIIMAQSTIPDENRAMKPRMGTMLGAPYGHEIELMTPGIRLFGQHFFWSEARPLATFSVDQKTAHQAHSEWSRTLETGTLQPTQKNAASARDAATLRQALRP